MIYEEQFQKAHQLLKDHGCIPTYSFEKEYQINPILSGAYFYQPEEMDIDHIQKEWREKVDAQLDVCVQTKKSFSEKDKIRFDIEWSQGAQLYSMYVSLPTSARSVSLSRNRYNTQKELINEIEKWLLKAGCKRKKNDEILKTEAKIFEQMSLF